MFDVGKVIYLLGSCWENYAHFEDWEFATRRFSRSSILVLCIIRTNNLNTGKNVIKYETSDE